MNTTRRFSILGALVIALGSPFCVAEEALYLHCFNRTTGQASHNGNPGEVSEETPPTRLITLRVESGSDFEALLDGHHHLSGRISQKDGSFEVVLEGAFRSGFAFSGKVELESVFDPKMTWFSGAVLTPRCVLSTHKEIEPFLEKQGTADRERFKKEPINP